MRVGGSDVIRILGRSGEDRFAAASTGPRGVASQRLDSHARVASTGVAFGPPMSMIRHRFGGNLRAARVSVSRRRPSRTVARPNHPTDPVGGGLWTQHRATGVQRGAGRAGSEEAPTEVGRGHPVDGFEEESE
jgi:hypothetical protein